MSVQHATPGSDLFALIRDVELRRVEARGHVYLDYTGAALYPESLLRQHARVLRHRTLGNPHSTNPAARAATEDITAAKQHVLHYFDADPAEYDVCFTGNASAALRLVGESFPWSPSSSLVLTADNHNSVNGIREFARRAGAAVRYVALNSELRAPELDLPLASAPSLLAYPAQSNFSGVRHPLSWIQAAHKAGLHVLLDAAAFAPTGRLSLRETPADFTALSFYKMFGYPSGIGALIARRAAGRLLVRPWFAGGTVDFASVAADQHRFKADAEAFEDGTVNFLAASAVSLGLAFLERIGAQRMSAHVRALTESLLSHLGALCHSNGNPVVQLYGPRTGDARGGTVAFNVLDGRGHVLDCEDVVLAAAQHGISLRSGCFCNPGAAERAFGFSADELTRGFARMPREFSLRALRQCMNGRPVGAVRASLGYGSNEDDIRALARFLHSTGGYLTCNDSQLPADILR